MRKIYRFTEKPNVCIWIAGFCQFPFILICLILVSLIARSKLLLGWQIKGVTMMGTKISNNTVFVSSDGYIEKDTKWDFQFTPEAKANNTSIDQLIASHIPVVALIISSLENGACLILRRGFENLLVARLGLLQVLLEVERLEEHSRALVELGLELDPVQPERVEEGAHALHDDEDRQGQDGPEAEDDEDGEGADERLAEAAGERDAEDELPQHLGELRDKSNGLKKNA